MIAWGFFRLVVRRLPCAAPHRRATRSKRRAPDGLAGFALVFLLLRAFSSGCAALTGVEAISNGVPAFRKPKSKNAATTLLLMGLHRRHHVLRHHRAGHDHRRADGREPGRADLLNGERRAPVGLATAHYAQDPVIAQVAEAVFGDVPLLFVVAGRRHRA